MVFITRKGSEIQAKILKCIEQEEAPISTRQLALKLKYAWHTLQQRCLELEVKGKISHVQIAGSHLWTKKQAPQNTKSPMNSLIDKELTALLEKQIQTLSEELRKKNTNYAPDEELNKETQTQETPELIIEENKK